MGEDNPYEVIPMPSAYAHLRFAGEVIPAVPPKYRAIVKNLTRLYNAGSQGPDPLFYYNPLVANRVEKQGYACHAMTGSAFFEEALAKYRTLPSEGFAAYLFGVLTHYCLDSRCHPLINAATEEANLDHMELETEFDRFLLQKDGKLPPHLQSYYKDIHLTRGERATAAALYTDLSPAAFGWCIRNLANVHHVATSRNRRFAKRLLGLGGRKGRAFLMTVGPNPLYAHLDQPILDAYENALADFPAMAAQLADALCSNAPLGPEFTPTFG